MHGYDIIDHNSLNPELGSAGDYEHFVEELHRHGMGQIVDIVPNHMGVMGSDNIWWLDVLENGEASEYADFFDIDWDPMKEELKGKVLIPILADQYGNELERGELKLAFDRDRGEFSIWYHQHRFPVDPAEYSRILGCELASLQETLGPTSEDFLELQSILTAFGHLPRRRGLSPEQRVERNREKEVQKRRLAALVGRSPQTAEFIDKNVRLFNGNPADPHSFESLHELIKAQAYRLAQWRVAADDINYRRFFDINDLAALRTENQEVFQQTHHFILQLVKEGKIDGLRIDHPDGLYDPAKYFCQLRSALCAELKDQDKEPYIVAEKILTGQEPLRKDWPVDGTTGYEFANLVNGLFVATGSRDKMERIYRSFTAQTSDFGDLVYLCKKLILKVGLASELNVLANLLTQIALSNRHTCDFTLNSLRGAIAEIIASFPVYRTYVSGRDVSPQDRIYVEQAVAAARKRSNAADLSVFDFIRRALLVEVGGGESETYNQSLARFAMKFQQVTAAVMAKGVEDTAFYRYDRLVSLNEVGGNPAKFGTSAEEFHRANRERAECWPHSMLSSSTHDSKRSEDVRARINVLSEMPALWRRRVGRWRNWNRGKKQSTESGPAPSQNDEYLLYQTLVGVWPPDALDDSGWKAFVDRIERYMLKAAREAKEHTSWANQNSEYENSISTFVRSILDRSSENSFLADFSDFHRYIASIGVFNGLSQCLLKMTSPGVPDIYQGNEIWNFALVDPDNRQPVDYEQSASFLERLRSSEERPDSPLDLVRSLQKQPASPELKLFVTWKVLRARREDPELFRRGTYLPLKLSGKNSGHIVAFARVHADRSAVVAVPRLCATLLGERFASVCDHDLWDDARIELPNVRAACYHSVFTGECLPVGTHQGETSSFFSVKEIIRNFPVALLLSEPSADDQRECGGPKRGSGIEHAC